MVHHSFLRKSDNQWPFGDANCIYSSRTKKNADIKGRLFYLDLSSASNSKVKSLTILSFIFTFSFLIGSIFVAKAKKRKLTAIANISKPVTFITNLSAFFHKRSGVDFLDISLATALNIANRSDGSV